MVLGLTPGGAIVGWNHEEGSFGVEESPFLWRLALYQGVKRYKELEVLLPARPETAQTCMVCNGSGSLREPYVCSCGGAGWVLEGDNIGQVTG